MRVALYARYSSDNQRDASIADQMRVCRAFAESHGWTIAQEYRDHAASGATLLRAGFQALMRDALDRRFDVVLAESLDRFSRDQEDTAGLFKRLTFADVRIVTVSEGDIGHLHVGFKGTMNALYLKDVREKTHRGMRGRVEAGHSAGGLCYGHRVVPVLEGQPRGQREVHPEEAAIVQRIFRAFVAGVSPKAIAKILNAEQIPGPKERRGARPRSTGTSAVVPVCSTTSCTLVAWSGIDCVTSRIPTPANEPLASIPPLNGRTPTYPSCGSSTTRSGRQSRRGKPPPGTPCRRESSTPDGRNICFQGSRGAGAAVADSCCPPTITSSASMLDRAGPAQTVAA